MSRNPALKAFQEKLQKDTFGMTRDEAVSTEVCISCKKPVDLSKMEEIDVREYHISGICPICFDELARDPDEPETSASSSKHSDTGEQLPSNNSLDEFEQPNSTEEGITSDDDDDNYH